MESDMLNHTIQYNPGDHVTHAGFPGVITEIYIAGDNPCNTMYNVRLRSGSCCVSGRDLLPDAEWNAESARRRVGGTFGS